MRRVYTIDPEYNFKTIVLGDPFETANAIFYTVVPAGYWFAAELTDKTSFGLVSCVVYPGFEFKDFELANEIIINALSERCPQHEKIIRRLV